MNAPDRLPPVLVAVYRGVVYRDAAPQLFDDLVALQSHVRDHVELLGLELVLDEAEGYAHLRHRSDPDAANQLPRLTRRHQLSYPVSLLLVLLRKKLTEHDARGSDPRLILTTQQIHDLVSVFLDSGTDEARAVDKLETNINKVVELGFLRRLRGQDHTFEVRRIIKSFVDAQLLGELEERLAEYRAHAEQKEP